MLGGAIWTRRPGAQARGLTTRAGALRRPGTSPAAGREVLIVLRARPAPTPAPADAVEGADQDPSFDGHARPVPRADRGSGDSPRGTCGRPTRYGFSIGSMSMARPNACSDQRVVPSTSRQLNADVLSASIDLKSEAPYASTGTMRRTGKPAAYNSRNGVDDLPRDVPMDDEATPVRAVRRSSRSWSRSRRSIEHGEAAKQTQSAPGRVLGPSAVYPPRSSPKRARTA